MVDLLVHDDHLDSLSEFPFLGDHCVMPFGHIRHVRLLELWLLFGMLMAPRFCLERQARDTSST